MTSDFKHFSEDSCHVIQQPRMYIRGYRASLALPLLALAVFFSWSPLTHAAPPPADLPVREEAAFRIAAAAVAPSIVAIETIGGLDTIDETPVGTGPSSGVIVGDDGYIASSSFNFAHKPASIVVSLADGGRFPAKLVARDEARKWVLLKIDAPRKLPVPQAVPEAELAVGQWSIAVGRTFDVAAPNVSIGVISAVHRIWGKAIQTDAKVSPANYGGAIVDLQGRVQGVLVPLSANHREDAAGVEWYDSGIGFAVPLAHINAMLPRMKAGETLKQGLAGIRFKGSNVYADPPRIAKCRAGSPAYEAGIRDDDLITGIDGRPVEIQAQVMEELHRRYAGDSLKVAFKRGDEKLERELKLVDHLDPYRRPFFGLLVERPASAGDASGGAKVRYVFADSPAAKAGLKPGDVITKFATKAITGRDDLRTAAADVEIGREARVEYVRDGATSQATLAAAVESEAVPKDLPAPPEPKKDAAGKAVKLSVPEFKNKADLYVPPQYDDAVAHGLVILLHPSGGFADKTTVERWRDRCAAADWLLVVPQAGGAEWGRDDLAFLPKAIDRTAASYRIDPTRVVAVGYEEGAVVAMAAAGQFQNRIRAAVVVNMAPSGFRAETDPLYPTSFYVAAAKNFPGRGRLTTAVEQLRESHFPVVVRELPNDANDWTDAAAAELWRWLEALDRI